MGTSVINSDGRYSIQGYTDNFRGLGKEAIFAHASSKDNSLKFGGFYDTSGHLINKSTYQTSPEKIVNEFKKVNIDLTKRTDELYLIACYANRQTAQEMANALKRPVVGFSQGPVYTSYKREFEHLFNNESTNIMHWESPHLIIKVDPSRWSFANLVGNTVAAKPKMFYPKV